MASLNLAQIRTIVVAGGAGFVGSHVVDDLLEHCPQARIRILDACTYAADLSRLDAAFRTGRVTFSQGDVGNLELVTDLVRDADLVVNAAGESHVDRAIAAPERFSLANAVGPQMLVEAVARRKVPLMIHVSSAEVYGTAEDGVGEGRALSPDNPLGASKAAAEMLIGGLRDLYGVDIRILRPGNLAGSRQNTEKLLPRFIELASVGRPLPVHGDGMQRRSFLSVADFCSALRTVVARGAPNATYNVGGAASHSVLDIARLVLDAVPEPVAGVAFIDPRPIERSRPVLSTAALEALGWTARDTLATLFPALVAFYTGRIPGGARRRLRNVPDLAPQVVVQPAGSGLFRSLERH
ncbi:NAD-dependent epimerase/dehydratase family protein [Rhizobium sp. TRM95111]|uniref:dTDP-glucose 4,6-dehydratase n=1 Tax=Rhizobium alarense TaxID=2846851 RepID=UPI001F37AC6A|nr:NAD-dependent epimerase/dehydratase family protein [Rhizobium alarense]MCF3642896.1 NAD-dependent epimerase/dehydratase family protein [Rhizobium alarense]